MFLKVAYLFYICAYVKVNLSCWDCLCHLVMSVNCCMHFSMRICHVVLFFCLEDSAMKCEKVFLPWFKLETFMCVHVDVCLKCLCMLISWPNQIVIIC